MRRWDPRLRLLLALAIGGGAIWLIRSLDGSMRLAVSELAAVPLLFALWLGATGLSDLFGAGQAAGAGEPDEPAQDDGADAPSDDAPR